jgi:hypothetical protein
LGAATSATTVTIGDVTSNSRFNDGGFQLTSTGTLNLTSGTFKLGASTATTFPGFTTRNISSGTTVEYASTAAQTYSTVPTYHHLTFSGNSTKSPSSTTMTVNGNLTISAGTVTAPSGNFTLLGNFSNSGTFTHNSGTVIFAGADSSTQAITGSTTFNNFTASTNTNSAGRTFNLPVVLPPLYRVIGPSPVTPVKLSPSNRQTPPTGPSIPPPPPSPLLMFTGLPTLAPPLFAPPTPPKTLTPTAGMCLLAIPAPSFTTVPPMFLPATGIAPPRGPVATAPLPKPLTGSPLLTGTLLP